MLKDDELIKMFQDHKKKAESGLALQYRNNQENQAFYAGDMMRYPGEVSIAGRARPTMVMFNKIKPYVSAVVGFAAQNRRKPDYIANIPDDQAQENYTNFLNGLSDYCRNNANADQVETQQDKDLIICGYGAIDTDISYGLIGPTCDPNGEIVMERLDPNKLSWDPLARKPSLLDARWFTRCEQFYRDEAEELFGEEFVAQAESSDGMGESDKQFFPYGGVYDKIAYDFADEVADIVNVYKHQWWEIETYWRAANPFRTIEDPQTQQYILGMLERLKDDTKKEVDTFEIEDIFAFDPAADYYVMTPIIKNKVSQLCLMLDISFSPMEAKRKCYYTALFSGTRIYKKFKSLDQRGFSIKVKTADFNEINRVWFGLVSSMREPATYYNKSLTEMMFIIASTSKGGYLVEKEAVEDIALFEKRIAQTNSVVEVEAGALTNNRVQPKAVGMLPNGVQDVLNIADQAMPEVAGFDKGFLGSSENRNETALLQRQRIKQVMSTLATYFDSITLYQKEHARLMIAYMRVLAQNSEGRLIRIMGQDGEQQFLQLTEDNFAESYDVEVGESPNDANFREMQSDTMLNLAATMLPYGINIYPVALKYLPINKKDINSLIQIVNPTPDPQAQQQKQALQQLTFEAQKADLNNKIADTQYRQAGVKERLANSMKTSAETQQTQLENHVLMTHPGSPVRVNA